jgi:chemosensory pili system protein ChpA (sensor histidine kinase/response regulator)
MAPMPANCSWAAAKRRLPWHTISPDCTWSKPNRFTRSHAGEEGEWIEVEEEVEEPVAAADPLAATAGFQASTEGIDDDIREIFLEEMQEEIQSLRHGYQTWTADATQLGELTPIRRSFHTLKGSGRLVGASVLGEFAWRVENMLNRVLDNTIQPHEGVQMVVAHAIDALPQLLSMLRDGTLPTAPLSAIMQAADQYRCW